MKNLKEGLIAKQLIYEISRTASLKTSARNQLGRNSGGERGSPLRLATTRRTGNTAPFQNDHDLEA